MKKHDEDLRDLLWLKAQIGKEKGRLLLFVGIQILLGAIGIGYAVFLKLIIDSAVTGSRAMVIRSLLYFGAFFLLQFLLQTVLRYLSESIRSSVENTLKARLFSCLTSRSYGAVTAVHSGEWMNRLTSDTVVVADAVTGILPGAAGLLSRMAAAGCALLMLLPGLTLLLFAGGLLMLLATVWMRKHLKRMHREIQERDGALRVFLTEQLGSLLMVKSYQQEDSALAGARSLMDDHKKARMKKNWFSNFCNGGYILVMNLALLLSCIYCGFGILAGTVSYGTFTAAVQLVGQLQSPIAGLSGYVPQYYGMLSSLERLMEAEAMEKEPEQKKIQPDFESFGLQNVTFTYDKAENPVLQDFSADVKKGEYLAFSGPSGCGKSTVLKLLLCLYAPDSGAGYVCRNGERKPLTPDHRGLFAYVPQGNQLMSGKIRDVVAFSRPEKASEDALLFKALDAACAGDFVRALPQGLDTELKERGAGLSEGQMQRIAVARAIFSGRPVLLLDEATSALDEKAEEQLLKNIRAMTDRTVLIVTHRPAALGIVDHIVYFGEEKR